MPPGHNENGYVSFEWFKLTCIDSKVMCEQGMMVPLLLNAL